MKKQFDRFVLTDQLAQGVGGSVFLGQEQLPGGVTRPVRVKLLPPISRADPQAEARFVNEVRILASLASHPHVVTFYGMGMTEGTPWIATEQVPATLESIIGQGPGNPVEVARLIEHVTLGLQALHALQPPRLHNRLCPANVIVPIARHFKITEFGLAAPANAEPMLSAESVRYAAPELITGEAGKPGPWTDLYALGHMAYELALGGKLHRAQFPAVADGSADLKAVNPSKWQAWHHSMQTVLPPVHEVVQGFPIALSEVIARLLAKPLSARYQSADQVIADVLRLSDASSTPAPAAMPGPPPMPGAPARPAGAPAVPRFAQQRTAPAAAPPPTTGVVPPAGGGPDVNARYFVRLRNQVTGPFDFATLQRMCRQGQVSRLHQVSTDQRAWKGAGTVEGLF